MSLGAGAVAFVVGAWAGLRVSLQRLCGISIAAQCILGVVWIPSMYMVSPFAAVLLLVTLAIHICNVVVIWSARSRGVEYPWRILKWTFLLTAIAICVPLVLLVVAGPAFLLDAHLMLVMAMMALPVCLQVVLLWLPGRRDQAAIDAEMLAAQRREVDNYREETFKQ